MGIQHIKQRSLATAIIFTAIRVGIVVGIAVGAHFLIQWVETRAQDLPPNSQGFVLGGILLVVVLAYAVLIAIPFVPGIEIGVSLMMIRGSEVAPVVYLATVLGLVAAFLAGRYLSYDWLHQVLMDLRLKRACNFLERIKGMNRQQRLDTLRGVLPNWAQGFAIKFRYVMLALLINIPGNSLIGGGGGISFLAGLTRLFSPWVTVLAIAVAVAPVPLLVWLYGSGILGAK